MSVRRNSAQILERKREDCSMLIFTVQFIFLQVYFGMIDALLAREELPDEYKSRKQVMKLDHLLYTAIFVYRSAKENR